MTTFQLTFALWELAKNRDIQEKLRTEVNEAWERVKARGDGEFAANDFENMPYLVAIGKVCRVSYGRLTGMSNPSSSRKH